MDLVARCKDKVTSFRIKELKDVLSYLGLPKQGKKQDLVDRILNFLSIEPASEISVGREGVAKLVDEIYRKMQSSVTADLKSKSEDVSGSSIARFKEEIECSTSIEKTRCLCGSTVQTDSMIKCEDPKCNVWQHMACVLVPEKPMDGPLPKPPDIFYCEICRLNRADPFWVTVAHPLRPVKLNITNYPPDGSNPSQNIEKKFQLSRTDRDLLTKREYDVQAWCMLLNDKVKFRMHWPQYADLQVNGVPVRAINRPGSQFLGANGRDDGQIITHCTRDGINKIFLGGCDARVFCLGVRIVKRRTLPQVINMIPKEDKGECFEDALSRVRRCVGGGAATENADSDSDIEVVADCIPVSLRCPMSGLRMKVAGRFKDCAHMGCFDLEVFLEMNQQSKKWQCPICLKNYSLEKIIIDPYFNRITSKMRNCVEDVSEIEVKPDGSWRAKTENGDRKGLGELGLWHFPDGRIDSAMAVDRNSKLQHKQIKEEIDADCRGGLRLGIKKNQNGIWEFNQLQAVSHTFDQNSERNVQNIIPMSSSATASGREREDGSINQGAGANRDISTMNGSEYESVPMNIGLAAQDFTDQLISVPGVDAEVIILSDSEEDPGPVLSSAAADRDTGLGNGEIPFPDPHFGIPDPYYEDPTMGKVIDLYGANDDDFGINMWSLPSGSQGGPGFQLFGSDVDVADSLLEMQNNTLNCASYVNGFALTEETVTGSAAVNVDPANKSDGHDSLLMVDNPLAFGSNDPSLQIFLPSVPCDALASHPDLRNHPDTPNGIRNEDWISLRLGDVGMNNGRLRQQEPASAPPLDPMADSGSLLPGTCDIQSSKTIRERPESPFSIPRQPRSVRSRLYLSIDSDSG